MSILGNTQQWFKDRGDETKRFDYPLNENSIVFDLGGYKGEWTEGIVKRFNSFVYIFEPFPIFFKIVNEKFLNNTKVKTYELAMNSVTGLKDFYEDDNASSANAVSDKKTTIQTKNINDFLKENNITKVDLIKINIEGDEYDILPALYFGNNLKVFKNIQVQFHKILPENEKQYEVIKNQLSETHELSWRYPFVWENWVLKN